MTLQAKLSEITHEIGAIPKTLKPDSGVKYAFRSIDDVMNALNPLLAKHMVTMNVQVRNYSIESRTIEKEGNGGRKYTQFARFATVHLALTFTSDGVLFETTEEIACSEDFSDKAYTQAMTMAFKYAIIRKFCITTADMEDPDGKRPEQPPPPPKGGTKAVSAESSPKGKKKIVEMDGNTMTKPWANLVGKLSSGVATMEMAKTAYELTEEQIKKLEAYVKK